MTTTRTKLFLQKINNIISFTPSKYIVFEPFSCFLRYQFFFRRLCVFILCKKIRPCCTERNPCLQQGRHYVVLMRRYLCLPTLCQLLSSVLGEIESDRKVRSNLLIVRLNGLLQTDDKIAIHEITRQLQLDNVVGDKVFVSWFCFSQISY